MELTTPSESLLLITVERPLLQLRWFVAGCVGYVCLMTLVGVFWQPREPAEGGLLGGILVLAYFMAWVCGFVLCFLLLLESSNHPVETAAFDTAAQQVTFTRRVLWRAWRTEFFAESLRGLAAVQLYEDESDVVLKLVFNDDRLLNLGSHTTLRKTSRPPLEVAETLSQFLNVPLRIKMGAGWVEKQPGHQA